MLILTGDPMEALKKQAVIKIMGALYKKERLYTSQIADETGLTLRHLSRILPKMIEDNLIKKYPEENKNYYELTVDGRSTVWALLHPEELVTSSEEEEIASTGRKGKNAEDDQELNKQPRINISVDDELSKSLSESLSVFQKSLDRKEPIKGLDKQHIQDLIDTLNRITRTHKSETNNVRKNR